jgi:hypothetical protein
MAETRKDAGQSRQRPRPPGSRQAEANAGTPSARPVGIAPVFDVETAQLKVREGPYKGMISNPWVRHWTQGAQEQAPEGAAEPSAEAGPRAEAEPGAEQAPAPGPRRAATDAGPAPRPARGND